MRKVQRLKLADRDTVYILGSLSLLNIQDLNLVPKNFYYAQESLTHFIVEKYFFNSEENKSLVSWFSNNPTEISFWLDGWIFNNSIWQKSDYGIMFRPGDPIETAFALQWVEFSKNKNI